MKKFSWPTMIIFVMVLLLGVVLVGLGTAYVSKLKQQHRQLPTAALLEPLCEVGRVPPFARPIALQRVANYQSSGGENLRPH
jgi:hypothetical protein